MTNVPILDEAYMQRRNQLLRMQAWSDATRRIYRPDTVESLREDYALGRITQDEFERRLERVLA